MFEDNETLAEQQREFFETSVEGHFDTYHYCPCRCENEED